MKKFLRGLFLVFYFFLLSAGIWVSRTFAVLNSAPSSPSADGWKASVQGLLAPHDNQPLKDSFLLEGREIFPAYKIKAQEDDQGQLLEFFNPEGFSFRIEREGPHGPFSFLLAIDDEGRITGLRRLSVSELRGIERAFEDADFFWESFKDKTASELFLVNQGGKIAPVMGAYEASARFTEAIRQEIEKYHQNKNLWLEEAMRERRSFQDLETFQEQAAAAPLTEESVDEDRFPPIF